MLHILHAKFSGQWFPPSENKTLEMPLSLTLINLTYSYQCYRGPWNHNNFTSN